ncbi:MAG: glycosyltransferase [Parvularculaceae bacterium]
MDIGVIVTAIGSSARLRAFIETFRIQHPSIPIYVGAQGRLQPPITDWGAAQNVHFHELPFDNGLSASRNYLVRTATEPYVLICDDDFAFTEDFGLRDARAAFDFDAELGVLGGRLLNIDHDVAGTTANRSEATFAYNLIFDRPNRTLVMLPAAIYGEPARRLGSVDVTYCDTVLNFCLIRRERVFDKGIWWDEASKIGGEHFEFFLRIKETRNAKVAYCPALFAEHHRMQSAEYAQLRSRPEGRIAIHEKLGIDCFVEMPFRIIRLKDGRLEERYTYSELIAVLGSNAVSLRALEEYVGARGSQAV